MPNSQTYALAWLHSAMLRDCDLKFGIYLIIGICGLKFLLKIPFKFQINFSIFSQVKAYVNEAIRNQQEGKELKADRRKPLVIPEELSQALEEQFELNDSFHRLSLSRQKEYAEYIAEARRESTKLKRRRGILYPFPPNLAKVNANTTLPGLAQATGPVVPTSTPNSQASSIPD